PEAPRPSPDQRHRSAARLDAPIKDVRETAMPFLKAPRLRRLLSTRAFSIATATGLPVSACVSLIGEARAQSAAPLPPVVVPAPPPQPKAKAKAAPRVAVPQAPAAQPVAAPAELQVPATMDAAVPRPGGSLTVPTTDQAQAYLARVPGSVVVVPDTAYKA